MTISQIIGWGLAVLGILGVIAFLTWYGKETQNATWKEAIILTLSTMLAVGLICGFILLVINLIAG